MSKFYSIEECITKSNQYSELGSLAALDGDLKEAERYYKLSDLWMQRAKLDGWQIDDI
jgi:hypothetical protein